MEGASDGRALWRDVVSESKIVSFLDACCMYRECDGQSVSVRKTEQTEVVLLAPSYVCLTVGGILRIGLLPAHKEVVI